MLLVFIGAPGERRFALVGVTLACIRSLKQKNRPSTASRAAYCQGRHPFRTFRSHIERGSWHRSVSKARLPDPAISGRDTPDAEKSILSYPELGNYHNHL